MAKFCTKCGKPLEEGKKCTCEKSTKETKVVEAKTESTKVDIKESLMDCLNVFKKIFTKPVEAIKEFVVENKFIAGIIMIVLAALSTGLNKIAVLKNAYSSSSTDSLSFNDFADLFSNALSGNYDKPEYFKEFLTTSLTNLAEYALIAVIGYVLIAKLLKGKDSWKNMVQAVAISLSIVLVGNVINSVLVFIDGDFIANIRSYVSSFASILSVLVLFTAVKETSEIDKNKAFISVASMSVLATAVVDIVQKLFD